MKRRTLLVIILSVLLSGLMMAFDWHNEINKSVSKETFVPYATCKGAKAPETPGSCRLCGWGCLSCEMCGRLLPD